MSKTPILKNTTEEQKTSQNAPTTGTTYNTFDQKVKETEKEEDPTLDSCWSWMVALGGFLLYAIALSTSRALAILLLEILERFETDMTSISLMLCLGTLGTSLSTQISANILLEHLPLRVLAIFGTTANVFCTLLFAAFPEFYMFCTTWIIKATLQGFFMVNSLSHVNMFFSRYRGLASSVTIQGINFASVVFPPLIFLWRETYGFQGCYLAIASTEVLGIVGACLMLPKPTHLTEDDKRKKKMPPEESSLEDSEVIKDSDTSSDSGLYNCVGGQSSPCETSDENLQTKQYSSSIAIEPRDETSLLLEKSTNNSNTSQSVAEKENTCPSCLKRLNTWFRTTVTSLFDVTLMTDPICLIAVLAYALSYAGSKSFLYIPSYAVEVGVSPRQAANLLTISSVVATFTGLLFGIFADLKSFKATTIVIFSALVMGVTYCAVPLFDTHLLLVCYVVIAGIFRNVYSNLSSLTFLEVVNLDKLYKILALGSVLGNLIRTIAMPIQGILKDCVGNFAAPQQFTGAIYALGAILSIFNRFLMHRRRKKETQTLENK